MKSANAGPGGNNQFGIQLHKRVGDKVERDEPLAGIRFDTSDAAAIDAAAEVVRSSFEIATDTPQFAGESEILSIIRD